MYIYYYYDCITIVFITAPSFYHSLDCYLMTLGLRIQSGDLRYHSTRYFTWYT